MQLRLGCSFFGAHCELLYVPEPSSTTMMKNALWLVALSLLAVLANGYIVPDVVVPVNTNYLGSYNEYNDLKVQTDSGIVQGEIKPNQFRPNFQVRQFIGIPYAQKPIDIYRFSVSPFQDCSFS